MARYFNSECGKPYFIQDEANCLTCGMYNGFVVVGSIAIALGVLLFRAYDRNNLKKLYITASAIVLGISLLVIPVMSAYSNRNVWLGYNKSYNMLVEMGLSKVDAMRIIFMNDYATSSSELKFYSAKDNTDKAVPKKT